MRIGEFQFPDVPPGIGQFPPSVRDNFGQILLKRSLRLARLNRQPVNKSIYCDFRSLYESAGRERAKP